MTEGDDGQTELRAINLLCRGQGPSGRHARLQQSSRCYGLPQTHLQLSEDRHPCQLGTLAPSAISLRLGVTRAALELSSELWYR